MSRARPAHALERVDAWRDGWRRSGRLVLLLDFDGTLAPIVARPELAAIPQRTRAALDRLLARARRAGGGRERAGEGVLVAESPPDGTAARAYVRSPEEAGALFEALAG